MAKYKNLVYTGMNDLYRDEGREKGILAILVEKVVYGKKPTDIGGGTGRVRNQPDEPESTSLKHIPHTSEFLIPI